MDPPAPGPSQIPGSVRCRATNFSASAPSPPAGRSREKSSAGYTDTFTRLSVRPSSDPAPNRRPRTSRALGADADAPRASLARGTRARVRVKLVRPTRPPQRVDHRTGASDEPPHGSSTPREPSIIVDRAKHSFFTPTNDRRKQVLRSKKDAKARGLSHDLPKQSSFHRRTPQGRRAQPVRSSLGAYPGCMARVR